LKSEPGRLDLQGGAHVEFARSLKEVDAEIGCLERLPCRQRVSAPANTKAGLKAPSRATEHGSGLGRMRWVVERTFAWPHQFRRLRIRWERRPELHQAFMHLPCALICQRFLRAL
jgi:hypothetical protein